MWLPVTPLYSTFPHFQPSRGYGVCVSTCVRNNGLCRRQGIELVGCKSIALGEQPLARIEQGEAETRVALNLSRNHSVVQAQVTQTLMAFDSCVGQRRFLVSAKSEHCLIHLGAVEDVEGD